MTGFRWRAAILSTLLAATQTGIAQDSPSNLSGSQPNAAAAEGNFTKETLDYAIEWRLIPAGTAKFTWAMIPSASSTSELRLHLESAGLVSRLFRVSDDYTAMLAGQN